MSHYSWLLSLAAATMSAAATAQSPPAAGTGTGSHGRPALLSHRAPLAGYQPFSDEKVVSWKEANDTVGRIGGWREYARESQQPGAAAPVSRGGAGTAPAPTPAPAAGHGGHANH
jgi:hypothetical protein